jgi:hypothetical protein
MASRDGPDRALRVVGDPVMCQDTIGRNRLEGPGVAARHSGMKSAEPGASARYNRPGMSVATLQFLLLVFAGWVNRRQVDQIARNLTDSADGFLRGKRYLIHDRDPLFTAAFHATLGAAGIECLKLPPQAPI